MNKKRALFTISLLMLLCSLLAAGTPPKLPDIETAILIDYQTGRILYSKNSDSVRPIASMTKIMTLYLTLEAVEKKQISLNDIVEVSTTASNVGGSQIYLKEHEKIILEELLKSTAIASANDAAVALAEYVSGNKQKFVEAMNKKAHELNLKNTIFFSPHGLPNPKNNDDRSSAYDIAMLSRSLIQKHPTILKWTSKRISSIRNGQFQLTNTNHLIGKYSGMDGLKTGYINKSGFCLAATAHRNNHRLISVVMGGHTKKSRFESTQKILDYGFENYTWHKVAQKGQPFQLSIAESQITPIDAELSKDLLVLVSSEESKKIEYVLFTPNGLKAPILAGSKLSEYQVQLNGLTLIKGDVVASHDILRASFFKRLFD